MGGRVHFIMSMCVSAQTYVRLRMNLCVSAWAIVCVNMDVSVRIKMGVCVSSSKHGRMCISM